VAATGELEGYPVMTCKIRRPVLPQIYRTVIAITVALGSLTPGIASGGVLSESDREKAESLRPLFANLMKDLVEAAKRPDVSSVEAGCINLTIRELLQISDELASYEYLISMDKDIGDFGEKNPMRGIVKFAAEKSNNILAAERKRLVQLSDQCARFPIASAKNQQALQVIDTSTGLLTAIRDRL
jgi:hypothetical protein